MKFAKVELVKVSDSEMVLSVKRLRDESCSAEINIQFLDNDDFTITTSNIGRVRDSKTPIELVTDVIEKLEKKQIEEGLESMADVFGYVDVEILV